MEKVKLDKNDWKILDYLKLHGRATVREIAKRTLIPISTVHNRLKKLNKSVIKNYTVRINYEKLGKEILVYVLINADIGANQKEIQKELIKKGYVERADIITGENDLITLIRCGTIKELNKIILNDIHKIKGVKNTKTMLVIDEGK